ncbi:MAG: (2Fe-2S)-binding protein [Candidatus Macondimonas sp.]|jgi:bacterioferritin-associated ferredoxin
MYVCLCRAVTDRDVEQAVACGHTTLPALQATLGVATGCGRCRNHVHQMLQKTPESPFSASSSFQPPSRVGVSVG